MQSSMELSRHRDRVRRESGARSRQVLCRATTLNETRCLAAEQRALYFVGSRRLDALAVELC
jgi:hypothetical protein